MRATSDRIPKCVLPVIRSNLVVGGPTQRSAAIVASWARYAESTDEAGEPIEVVDKLREELMSHARRQGSEPLSFLANERVFGDLAQQPAFAAAYLRALDSFRRLGARATLARINAELSQ